LPGSPVGCLLDWPIARLTGRLPGSPAGCPADRPVAGLTGYLVAVVAVVTV